MAERLRNKVAIITGAGSGIGRGTAELFAEEGARLVLVDWEADRLAESASRIQSQGGEVRTVHGDVGRRETNFAAAEAARSAFGRIDIAFSCAAIMPFGDFMKVTPETWEQVLQVNLTAMFHMAQAVVPTMLDQGSGSIIHCSSIMATQTEAGYEAYTTSKAGAIGFTKALAVSYAERGIRVNAICPGWVETGMTQFAIEDAGGMENLIPLIRSQQPQARMAQPREIGHAVLFLGSDESSGVTGSVMYVDGGCSASL